MTLAIVWTVLGVIGLAGAIRNVERRRANIRALKELRVDGPLVLTAQLFRNSELIRMGQALIGVSIGVTSILLYQSDYYRRIVVLREAGGFPPLPMIVRVFNDVLQGGLLLWMILLVTNIFYFGAIGDRVARLVSEDSS